MFSDTVSELEASNETVEGGEDKEPVYFTVEPDDEKKRANVVQSNLTVDENAIEVINPANKEGHNVLNEMEDEEKVVRRNTYDSDDEINPDQEFSFIEDENNSFKSSSVQQFSVDIKKDNATVLSKILVKKNEFVEMMERFDGFPNSSLKYTLPISGQQ